MTTIKIPALCMVALVGVTGSAIGPDDAEVGSPTQMAVFSR